VQILVEKNFKAKVVENSSNQRNLFSATRRLLNQSHEVPFPTTSDKLVLANEMGSFFVEKIDTIHAKLDRLADCFFMIPILTM